MATLLDHQVIYNLKETRSMRAFTLSISGLEIIHLLRAELAATGGQPELAITCEKDFIIEEDFDHTAYGIKKEEEHFDLVISVATLTVEPRREAGYWILSVVVERSLGLVPTFEITKMTPTQLTLDDFEIELRSARRKEITARLDVQTPDVKQDFDAWLADMRGRHLVKDGP